MNLTKCQLIVLETLADVAEHEGGEIVLKNRYHAPAASLVRAGLVTIRDDFPYRPKYQITNAGIDELKNHITAERQAVVLFDGWAGRTSKRCAVIGETSKRYRVRWLEDVPARGQKAEQVQLVPKGAIRFGD